MAIVKRVHWPMISNNLFKIFILVVAILSGASMAPAGCLVRDIESVQGDFQTYIVCENSLSSPNYMISSYMGTMVSFSLFSFDHKGASYLCHDYENKDESEMKCTVAGIKKLKSVYKTKNASIHMLDISKKSGLKKAERIFKEPSRFSTADSLEAAQIDGCFIRIKDTDIYFGYEIDRFNLLANCIVVFEGEISKNKKLLFGLM